MKTIHNIVPFSLVALLALVMMVGGCEKRHPYDNQLVVVDSIMRHDPDSALALLGRLGGAGFATAGDQAYFALLLTQARYRCYVVATSDSTINIALDYYRHHDGEREKLTRAYIYKGAVMEELGDPKAAMNYYQEAKSVVAPEDLFNQGYIRLRMGYIYRDNVAADAVDITLIKQALHYFKQIPDSFYILTCQNSIGSSYVGINQDSALLYLEQAWKLAKQLHQDGMEETCLRYLADLKMFSDNAEDMEMAKRIALSQVNKDKKPEDELTHFLLIAAYTLARQDKPDSAAYYLNQVRGQELSDGLRVLYNKCYAELAMCHGDIKLFEYYYEKCDRLSDSIANNDVQRQLRDVEMKYDNEALKYKTLKYKTNWQLSLLGALLLLSVLAIALMMISRKSAQRKRLLQESQDTIDRLHGDTARLTAQLAKNEEMSEDLKQTIRNQIETFTHLVEMHYQRMGQNPRKFVELFKKSYSVSQPDLSFWTGIRAYADSTCGGIISRTVADHPEMSESDLRFMCLCCCELPTTVIMACMGYNDAHSVYNKKRRIGEALGLKEKLDDYLLSCRPQD